MRRSPLWRGAGLPVPHDFDMVNGAGSPGYTCHTMMQDLYYDAKETDAETGRRAGGPIRRAGRPGIMRRVPSLAEFVHSDKARLTGRLDMMTESFPHDGLTAILCNARDDSYNALGVPGLALQNSGVEWTIRDCVVPDRNRGRFLNERAAHNHSVMRSFAATCRKNDISPYRATLMMAEDTRWSIFDSGIPPPTFGRGAPGCGKPPSARSGPP